MMLLQKPQESWRELWSRRATTVSGWKSVENNPCKMGSCRGNRRRDGPPAAQPGVRRPPTRSADHSLEAAGCSAAQRSAKSQAVADLTIGAHNGLQPARVRWPAILRYGLWAEVFRNRRTGYPSIAAVRSIPGNDEMCQVRAFWNPRQPDAGKAESQPSGSPALRSPSKKCSASLGSL